VSPTVMLVSPSLDFLLFMKHMLETDGFAVVLAKDPDEVVERVEMIKPQAVIAECRASSTMCRELCIQLKTAHSTRLIAFIPLIEPGAEALYLEMIQAGADRPFHRPFEPIKLLEYLRTLSADRQRSDQQGTLSSGGIELNVRTRRVQRDGLMINLGALEFNLLQIFLQNPGRVFRREELIALGWPANTFVDNRTVDVRIGLLRRSLRSNGGPDVIRTVRGIGYAFDADQQD
jgi:two-component system phosphate regulon response regulator PhoB